MFTARLALYHAEWWRQLIRSTHCRKTVTCSGLSADRPRGAPHGWPGALVRSPQVGPPGPAVTMLNTRGARAASRRPLSGQGVADSTPRGDGRTDEATGSTRGKGMWSQ